MDENNCVATFDLSLVTVVGDRSKIGGFLKGYQRSVNSRPIQRGQRPLEIENDDDGREQLGDRDDQRRHLF
jgi:hypothetical protein